MTDEGVPIFAARSVLVARAVALSFACIGVCAALPGPAPAQELEGSTFEQSGKLRFKFKDKYGTPEPGGGVSAPDTRRIKYAAESVVVFGPAADLAADEFAMPIVFSEGVLFLTGTWSANAKGKVRLEVDRPSVTAQLDALVLGDVQDCRVKAKLKVREKHGSRSAKTRVKIYCRLRGVKPRQKLRVRFKASGTELLQ